jgi:hypothetical protein
MAWRRGAARSGDELGCGMAWRRGAVRSGDELEGGGMAGRGRRGAARIGDEHLISSPCSQVSPYPLLWEFGMKKR